MARVKNTIFSALEAGEGSASSDENRARCERIEEDIESPEVGEAGSDEDLDKVEGQCGRSCGW